MTDELYDYYIIRRDREALLRLAGEDRDALAGLLDRDTHLWRHVAEQASLAGRSLLEQVMRVETAAIERAIHMPRWSARGDEVVIERERGDPMPESEDVVLGPLTRTAMIEALRQREGFHFQEAVR